MSTLDDMDRKILAILQKEADIPIAQLAERVGMSQSPCWRRVKKLRDEGVIIGQVALVDPKRAGLSLTVLATVSLNDHHDETVAAFERAVEVWPEVLECHAVSGDRDYHLRIVAADMEDYERFLSGRLLKLKQVASVNSRFSLRRVKYATALPV